MKAKIFALLLALVLVVSAIPALADQGRGGDDDYNDSYDDSDDSLLDTRGDGSLEDDHGGLRIETKERIRVDGGEIRTEVRERIRDGVLEIRESYRERKAEFEHAREEYRDRREALIDTKASLRACQGRITDSCIQARVSFTSDARDFIISAGSKILGQLDRLEAYVQENVDDNETQAELLLEIDTVRVDVVAAIDAAEALPDNATSEELAAVRDQVQKAWQEVRELTNTIKERIVLHKVQNGTERMRNLLDRLNGVRDTLEENGADVTHLDELLDGFTAELDASANADTRADAQEHFRNAVHMLREIMQEIRDLRRGLGADDNGVDVSASATVTA